MSASFAAETAESVKDFVLREVAGGFTPLDEIVANAVDFVSDEVSPDLVLPYAQRCLDEAVAGHREQQRAWPRVTDCDRLDAAFAALEACGVVARQNFTCCQTCGHAEIWDEIEGAGPPPAHGYTFYHSQDTDSAVDGHGLCLAYGATDRGDEAATRVGHEIVQALRTEGLDPKWDGSVKTRIQLPLVWRRRR